MESFIAMIVVLAQLLLTGLVVWGGWLAFGEWLRGSRAHAAADAAQASPAKTQADDFERVASLVLLALLCTTLMAAA